MADKLAEGKDLEMLAGEDCVEVNGVKIYFPKNLKPVVIGFKVMFPSCVIENEIFWRGIDLRIAKNMNAEHGRDFLRVYYKNAPPRRQKVKDDWPLSKDINLGCKDKSLIETYDTAVHHLKDFAKKKNIWFQGSKIYYPPYISPVRRPNEIDFSTKDCPTSQTLKVRGKKGNLQLVVDTDHMARYVDDGVQICDKICGMMDLHSMAKALEKANPLDASSTALSPAEEICAMVPGLTMHREEQLMIRNLTIYYPIGLMEPIVEGKDVKFDGALDKMPLTQITLHPPAKYDVLHDEDEVHIFPPELKMLNVVPLTGGIEQRKHNRVGRRDRAARTGISTNPDGTKLASKTKSGTDTKRSKGDEAKFREAIKAAWEAACESPDIADDIEGSNGEERLNLNDPLTQSLVSLIQDVNGWQSSQPHPSDFTTGYNPDANHEKTDPAPADSVEVSEQVEHVEQSESAETPKDGVGSLVDVQEGYIQIKDSVKIMFPKELDHIVCHDYMQFGDGKGPMQTYRSSRGGFTVFCPSGWRLCYHVDGRTLVPDESFDAATEEFMTQMGGRVCPNDKSTAGTAQTEECTLAIGSYPEGTLTIGGVQIMFPTDAVPIIQNNNVRFPGGLTREIAIFATKGRKRVRTKLFLGEEWNLTRNEHDNAVVYRKSHPSVQPEETELPGIDKSIKQHERHCDKCPPVKTPYKEFNIWAKGELREYWFWFPKHLKPEAIEGKGYPVLRFPGSNRVCNIGEVEFHYPPNCDIVLGHEVHIYPKESKVIELYKQEIANKFYNPKPPRLLGQLATIYDTTFMSLLIEPAERGAAIKDEADWLASQDIKEIEKQKKAEEKFILTRELFADRGWSKKVMKLVDDAVRKIKSAADITTNIEKQIAERTKTIYEEAIQKEMCKREKSEVVKEFEKSGAEWLAGLDEKCQRAMDIIEELKRRDKEKEEQELQHWKEYVQELLPMPAGMAEPADESTRQLTEAENEVLEDLIAMAMAQMGLERPTRPRPAKRVPDDAPALGKLLKYTRFEQEL